MWRWDYICSRCDTSGSSDTKIAVCWLCGKSDKTVLREQAGMPVRYYEKED